VGAAVNHLLNADVIGFSAYVWNIRLSLAVAQRVKQLQPETLIVFGGPQVPDHAESFLREHPFIDVVCHGEGEAVFAQILDRASTRDWTSIPGISFVRDDVFIHHPKGPRIRDLDTLPSPYREGTFAPLMQAHPEERWVVLWETNRGCPFSCAFCDWGSATNSKVYQFNLERIIREVDWFAEHRVEFVICCDANFGMLPRDYEIAEYVVESKNKCGYPHSFLVQNTKNATERSYRIQKLLNDSMNTIGVTISLQSLDKTTLANIKRTNISSESFQELQRRYAAEHIYTYTDLILSLPGETYATFVQGVARVIENGQHNHVQFHNLSILPNAEMGSPAYQQQYGLVSVEQRIINSHASLTESEQEDVPEFLRIVVATDTLPADDWVRAKIFWWMANLLHFDHLLQIPFVVLHERWGLDYSLLIETITEASADRYPVLAQIHAMLRAKARAIQHGEPEYCPSEQWLNIWWPADQFILIWLVANNHLEAFYRESEAVLLDLLRSRSIDAQPLVLHEAIMLNLNLLVKPGQTTDLDLSLSHTLWEYYQSILTGRPVVLEQRICRYRIQRARKRWPSIPAWCGYLIWCQNKDKTGYLYQCHPVEAPNYVAA
jgi:tRNA A37 methylthiotransferase MiaB